MTTVLRSKSGKVYHIAEAKSWPGDSVFDELMSSYFRLQKERPTLLSAITTYSKLYAKIEKDAKKILAQSRKSPQEVPEDVVDDINMTLGNLKEYYTLSTLMALAKHGMSRVRL